MRFGVILPNYGPQASPQALLATAREAERLGFHSLWATDHLLLPPENTARFGVLFEAITAPASLAGVTLPGESLAARLEAMAGSAEEVMPTLAQP